MRLLLLLFCFGLSTLSLQAEDGYRLWLRYDPIQNTALGSAYRAQLGQLSIGPDVDTTQATLAASLLELRNGLRGLLGVELTPARISVGTSGAAGGLRWKRVGEDEVAREGYRLRQRDGQLELAASSNVGFLYGTFHLLRLLQTEADLKGLDLLETPAKELRILNHWDNLDGTVERGYAGFSIFNWHTLPDVLDPRYTDYARACASVGINGSVVTNVNANSLIFREDYLEKAAALADVFRPYGVRLYLTARFSAPVELGGLETADPLDPAVIAWWAEKTREIYEHIPDFGGFVVKANSEGQPGPREYGRSHAEGANVLADALAPYGGIVMWRAFVYNSDPEADRAAQAYEEFVPLDGKFRDNVMVQVKNGPIDFQPREPFSPLFGATPETPLLLELQITKEYLGQGTHLVGLAPLFSEVLQADTRQNGPGTTVASTVSGLAGVSNVGTARNWTGHPFGQADWYAFGRLAWDPALGPERIYDEWAAMTYRPESKVRSTITEMLITSREICVNYMTPLGLHHLMATGHHYGPGPWVSDLSRPEWNPAYYHRADSAGIGFDRTVTGSNAVAQYAPEVRAKFADPETCPPEYLLWFHHLPWDFQMDNGNTLWEELCYRYQAGVDGTEWLAIKWAALEGEIDPERHAEVSQYLTIQQREAEWWKNACLAYFQTFAQRPFPDGVTPPPHDVDHYRSLDYPYAPGIRPQW
ncbi:alpha-glucuronidase family glycosyl hydrolase [Neolewinella litorea]|uniref:Xylan alpha-1,2-glucuronidase n=1 Tax=Neolewinella litorea TaxID=2562452 RepID=A0A4S4NNV5_9BACT|nr:alpha-glucuronidase family glycosyl hydrolase [Neolewinella litorea]THH41699.1 alpha-glucuronidase [Neolewinella litorea]